MASAIFQRSGIPRLSAVGSDEDDELETIDLEEGALDPDEVDPSRDPYDEGSDDE